MSVKRKPIPKKKRELVYKKYNGHCAYCGCELEMKDMQVDHVLSLCSARWRKTPQEELDDIENLMPSCRSCNYYKGTLTLEGFRRELSTLMERVSKEFIYRLAKKYGMVSEQVWDGRFYFEKVEEDIEHGEGEVVGDNHESE